MNLHSLPLTREKHTGLLTDILRVLCIVLGCRTPKSVHMEQLHWTVCKELTHIPHHNIRCWTIEMKRLKTSSHYGPQGGIPPDLKISFKNFLLTQESQIKPSRQHTVVCQSFRFSRKWNTNTLYYWPGPKFLTPWKVPKGIHSHCW